MDDHDLLSLLHETADAVRAALEGIGDWSPMTPRPGQYAIDLVADAAALTVLDRAGVGVLSEESGVRRAEQPVMVVVDPVDGSTNAARRIPWYATSLCALDGDGPRAALVVNQASGERFEALRGAGARLDGNPLEPSAASGRSLASALVLLNGYPPRHPGWRQYRALGAASLDLCAVAAGRGDGYLDCTDDALGPWDFMGGLLVCQEAGAVVADVDGRPLVAGGTAARRTLVAAATADLAAELLAARRSFWTGPPDPQNS